MQSPFCGFGGAEYGKPIPNMTPPEGNRVGPTLTLSTIHALLQLQPGYKSPSCCKPQPTPYAEKVSLGGCTSCGGGGGGSFGAGAGAGAGGTHMAAMPVGAGMNQLRLASGSGAFTGVSAKAGVMTSAQPGAPSVHVVAVGADWCGWSKKQAAAVADARNPRVRYTNELPSDCPKPNGYPSWFASNGSTYALLQAGYLDVSDPQLANKLLQDAERKLTS